MDTIRPKQRVSVAEKMKKEYYMNNMKYYIDIAISSNDKTEVKENIDAANGEIPDSVYGSILTPLTGSDGNTIKLPGEIRKIDFITPIREKNMGEYLQLPRAFTVKVDDPNINLIKNKEIGDLVKPILEQAIVNKINEIQNTGVPNQEIPDIEKLVEETLQKWTDKRADNAQLLVKSILNDNNKDALIMSLYNDWWSTEHVFTHVSIENGGLSLEEISPMEGFTVENGYEFVSDHEAFLIIRPIAPDVIEEKYKDKLTSKDRDYLANLTKNSFAPYYSVPVDIYKDYRGAKSMDGVSTTGGNVIFANDRFISEYVLYYKTEVKRDVLYYINQLGEIKQRVIEDDEDFVFDENLGHLEIEKVWIQETWKQVLLGDTEVGVYLKPSPIEVQMYDSQGHNKLPIVGKKGILNNLYINPIPKRVVPNAALYRVITLNIERQFAKYKGTVELIPQSMLQSDDAQGAKGNMFYRLADNTFIYDDTQIDFNTVAQGYRLVGNDAQTNYIKALIEFRNMVKEEAWDMANMNDSRYGNAAPSSTVTNNKQNIYNAKLGSVLSITMFNNILVQLYEMILNYCEYLYPEGISGSVRDDDGSIKYFNIDSGVFTANKLGIHMTNSVFDFEKLEEYKQLAFSAGQHGEFGLAAKAIDGDSISSIRTELNEYIELKTKYERELEQQKIQQLQQAKEAELQDKQADRDAELEKVIKKEELITERELQLASINNNDKE